MRCLTTQRLLPGPGHDIKFLPRQIHGIDRRGRIAKGEAFSVIRDPIAVRYADTTGRTIPSKNNVAIAIDLYQIRQFPISRLEMPHVLELQLLCHIGYPAGTK